MRDTRKHHQNLLDIFQAILTFSSSQTHIKQGNVFLEKKTVKNFIIYVRVS